MREDLWKPKVYLADVRPLLSDRVYEQVIHLVPESRREKADALQGRRAKAASLAAGFLAKYALRQLGFSDREVCYPKAGQPVVKGDPPLFLSLSHSGDYAACTVSAVPVGVDIQEIRPVRFGVLRHFFEEDQCREFKRQCRLSDGADMLTGDSLLLFMRYWAVKESYMKLTGQGMRMGFQNLSLNFQNQSVWEIAHPERPARFLELKAPDGYVLAICQEA